MCFRDVSKGILTFWIERKIYDFRNNENATFFPFPKSKKSYEYQSQ